MIAHIAQAPTLSIAQARWFAEQHEAAQWQSPWHAAVKIGGCARVTPTVVICTTKIAKAGGGTLANGCKVLALTGTAKDIVVLSETGNVSVTGRWANVTVRLECP